MVNRRKFLSLAALSLLAVPTQISLAGLQDEPSTESLTLTPELQRLEAQLSANAGHFSWHLHNELRHHYLAVSERMSRMHSDIILSHSILDGYVMNTVSHWLLTDNEGPRDLGLAVAVLLNNVERYGEFVHLKAASLIKAGDVYREQGLSAEATQLYSAALNVGRFSLSPVTTYVRTMHSRTQD